MICLQKQLNFTVSIFSHFRGQIFRPDHSQNNYSDTLNSLQQILRYIWVGFWFQTKTQFIVEIFNSGRSEECNFLCKTVLGFFKKALALRDLQLFRWEMLKFKQLFLRSNLTVISKKTTIFFGELEYSFLINCTQNKEK